MIEPDSFYANEETSYTNHYQAKEIKDSPEIIAENALTEFNNLKSSIEQRGIEIVSMRGSKDCPDHIFPNWFITFENKTIQIFPMNAENRRREKTPEILNTRNPK